MRSASSAASVWRAVASASANTATVGTPTRRPLRKMGPAISPRLATSSLFSTGTPPSPRSRAEDAEAGRFLGRVPHGREAEREHPACVLRVDDAIVPQTRRGVVGMALALVLL